MTEILTSAEMRATEAALFAAGVVPFDLMRRAGLAAADAIQARHSTALGIAVLCGPGNNGGDGWIVAAELARRGRAVDVISLVPRDALKGDAARAAALWTGDVTDGFTGADFKPGVHDVIVDALFGIGVTRPLEGSAFAMLEQMNVAAAQGTHVIAIDLPSGIDADTGAVHGIATKATETLTFHRPKRGLVLEPGRTHAGTLHVIDIGIPKPLAHRVTTNTPALWRAAEPRLDASAHKYTRGHALVLAGGLEGVGAARLAARAALRIGAGLVTIGCAPDALVAHAARGPDALMARAVDGAGGLDAILADRRRNAVLIGPAYGLGAATQRDIARVLQASRATVLDADALTSFAGEAVTLARLIATAPQTVLTPHAGEFARLFSASSVDKITRTLAAAELMRAVIVHKGADTVIAAPDGRAAVNINGTPLLATAGSGDVLAGMITGLLAQGMPAFEASCAAVYRHAAAAHRLGRGLIADDLADAIGAD